MIAVPFCNSVRRQRRPNFSHAEVKTLIDCVEETPELNTNDIGEGKRFEKPQDVRVAWSLVAQKVSSVSTIVRGMKEVRDKWLDMKCRIKKKAASLSKPDTAAKRTPLTHLEQRMLRFISPSVSIGIMGGVSTLEDFFEVEEEGESLKELFPVEVKKEILEDTEEIYDESSVLPDYPMEDNDTTTSEADGELQCSLASEGKENILQEEETPSPPPEAENSLPDTEIVFQPQVLAVTTAENGLPDEESVAIEQNVGVIIMGDGLTGSSEGIPKRGKKRKHSSKVSSETLEEKLDTLIKRKSEKNEILKDIKSVLTQFLFVQQDMLATQEEINCSLKTLLRDKIDKNNKQ